MPRCFSRFFACAAVSAGLHAAEPARPWPPWRGEVSGTLALPRLPGFPTLAWQLEAQPLVGAGLSLGATATGPGFSLRLAVTPPVGETPGTWRIVEATIDAAAWWRLSVEQAGIKTLPADVEFGGQLTVRGSGQWVGPAATGTLQVALVAGTAGSAAQHWTATGIVGDAELVIDSASDRAVIRTARIGVETLQIAGLPARNLRLDVAGAAGGRLSITRAEVAALGGRIALSPFTIDPAEPAVKSTADFSGVALGDLAALVPQALKEAAGQVSGRFGVNWTLKSGLGPGDGSITVSSAQAATVRLAPSPGLLTGNSPPRIGLLPRSFGPLSRWVSLENPAHGMLRRIELGEVPLAVESFRVELYPDGAAGARSAQIHVVARTTGARDVVEKVTFTVNVSGPLDQVLRLGTDDRAKIKFNFPK